MRRRSVRRRAALRFNGADAARGLKAIHHGHEHVHEDAIRLPRFPHRNRLLPVFGLAQGESKRLQQLDEQLAIDGVFIHNQQSVARLIGLQGDDPAARRQRGLRRLLNYRDGRDAGKTRAASRLALRGQIAA